MSQSLNESLQTLLDLADSGPAPAPPQSELPLCASASCRSELQSLPNARNGFTIFGGALLIRSVSKTDSPLGVVEWNAAPHWSFYGNAAPKCLMFGADIFGYQFGIAESGIVRFSPESADVDHLAGSLASWADWVVSDPDEAIGAAILERWKAAKGNLPSGHHLMALKPFVLGGGYTFDNLLPTEEAKQMRIYGPLAQQIHGVPNGTEIVFKVTE